MWHWNISGTCFGLVQGIWNPFTLCWSSVHWTIALSSKQLRVLIWENHVVWRNDGRWGSANFNHISVILYVWTTIHKNLFKKIWQDPPWKIQAPPKMAPISPLLRSKKCCFRQFSDQDLIPKVSIYDNHLLYMSCSIFCLYQAFRKTKLSFGMFHLFAGV